MRAAGRALRAGVVLQCATLAWLAWRHGTSVDSLLFMELGTREALAHAVDVGLAALAFVAALALLVRPTGGALIAAAVVVALVFLAQALAARAVGGHAFHELAPAAHAVRWLAPLALVPLGARPARPRAAIWLLRLAVAATFLAHGWEALRANPAFLDLVLGAFRTWTGASPGEDAVRTVLVVIGIADVLTAVGLVAPWTRRRASLALWAALWGVLTAASRTVALGPEFVQETTLRALNGLAPFALACLLRAEARAD